MKTFFSSLSRDIREFTTLSPQVKFLLIIQVIILFILSILVGVLFSPRFTNNVRENNVTTVDSDSSQQNEGKTALTITPEDEVMKIGEERIMTVVMTGKSVTAVDIVLTYDPEILSVREVTNGSVFEREIVNRQETGKIIFSAAHSPSEENTTSEGDIVTFAVQALKKTETTTIEFSLPETIAAENGVNTLGVTQHAQLHVFD